MDKKEKQQLINRIVAIIAYLLLSCIAAPVVALVIRLCIWIITGT